VGVFGEIIYTGYADLEKEPAIPWPIFVAGLVYVFSVGLGMLIWRYKLAKNFNPNDEAIGVRTGS
jgi:hypothetical protein